MPDLYRLTKEQLLELDGFQEKSATNVITSIEASKAIPFRRVLFGLNIPDVGFVTARNLAGHFGSVERLLGVSQEEIMECEGIGPDRAESIAEWFADEPGAVIDQMTFAKMKSLGLDPAAYLANNDATAFFSATGDLVLTGPTLTNVNDVRVILVDPA